MKIYEIGTGYTAIPARRGAATEIVAAELASAFLQMGEQVQVVDIAAEDRAPTSLPIREVPVPRCFRGTDVKLGLMHKLKRVAYSVCLAAVLRRILREETKPAVLHFHNQYNLFFFLLLTRRGLRQRTLVAYTNHSGIWRQSWKEIEKTVRRRYFQEVQCMRKADLVFLLNQETRENVVQHLGVSGEKTVLIGNGVNTEVYRPLPPAEKQAAKAQWGLSGCRVLLQVGSVNENKGQLRAAESLLPVLKKHPELVFAYAGAVVEEDYQQKLTDFAEEQHLTRQIRYLGESAPGKPLNRLYNTADATILPSRFESFGLVAVESMAAGVPVLLEKSGGVSFAEGVIRFDASTLDEIVESLLQSRDETSGRRAREFVQAQYSWKKIADEYLSAFRNGRTRE